MRNRQLSVSALVRYLKGKLDQDPLIQRVIVAGEISNFTAHRSGHWYFTLKDEKSRISCVMFASNAARCKFIPKEGDSVLVQANTSIFESIPPTAPSPAAGSPFSFSQSSNTAQNPERKRKNSSQT